MLGAKAAGYHGLLIFLANGISYVGRYVGLVQSRRKKMSLRTIGVNLVASCRYIPIPLLWPYLTY